MKLFLINIVFYLVNKIKYFFNMLFMYILTNVFFIFSIYSFMILLIYIARLLRFSVELTIAIFPSESKILFTYIELLAIKGFYRSWHPD